MMTAQLTAIVRKEEDWWIGWVKEIPGANAQERTREELLASLREAATDIMELNREEARKSCQEEYEEVAL